MPISENGPAKLVAYSKQEIKIIQRTLIKKHPTLPEYCYETSSFHMVKRDIWINGLENA